jgi:hypothetical protein
MASTTLPSYFQQSTSSATQQTLVIFDRHLADLELLYNALASHAIAFTIDNTTDALPAIAQILSDTGAKSLAIVAHGTAGKIQLGAGSIDLCTLDRHAGLLREWGVNEIALYSCEVGADPNFISRLTELTGANIAATTGKVGAAALGGNWELDKLTAEVFTTAALDAYPHTLISVAITSDKTQLKAGETATITFTFDAAPTDFLEEDIRVKGGILSNFAVSQTDSKVYTAAFTPAETNQLKAAISIDADKFTNVGNDNTGISPEYNPIGNEFRVNTYTVGRQFRQAVTALSNGGFVVTWHSDDQGIYGQRYDGGGQPQGDEFQISTTSGYSQTEPTVTALNDGGFVVTWTSYGQDGDSGGIYGQRYDGSGTAQGSEFQVNTYTANIQYQSAVTALSNGGFVVTWTSSGQDGDDIYNTTGVYGQRYDGSGTAQGGEFQINTTTGNSQLEPAVTALSNGGFVVTWNSNGQDGDSGGVYGQRYDGVGQPQGDEFQVNTYTSSSQFDPAVTALNDGGFVVTWSSGNQDGAGGYGIYGQRFNSSGTAQGDEFRVNTYTTNNQLESAVTALNDGGFVVTWSSYYQDGSYNGVYGQRYDGSGQPQGDEFRVNTYTASDQSQPAVTALSDGGFIVTWSSADQDGSNYGVYGQRFAPINPLTITGDTQPPAAPTELRFAAADIGVGNTEFTSDNGRFSVTIPMLGEGESSEYTTNNGASWTNLLGSGYGERSFSVVGEGTYAPDVIQVRTKDAAGNTSVVKYNPTFTLAAGTTALSIDANGNYVASNRGGDSNITYAGNKVSPNTYAGWQVIGVEIVRGDGEEVKTVWKSDSGQFWYSTNTDNGGIIANGELIAKEFEFGQDFDGDGSVGKTPSTIESFGTTILTTDNRGEYLANKGGASSVNILYAGNKVSPTTYAGWQVVGAEIVGDNENVKAVWKSDNGQFYYSTNTNTGSIISGGELIAKEIEFAQDFDGDGSVGKTPTDLEYYGTTILGTNNLGEYIASNGGEDINITYAGNKFSPTTYAGWQVIGAEIAGDDVKAVWKSNSGQFWYSTNTDDGDFISGNELLAKEVEFQQDFDGDGFITYSVTTGDDIYTINADVAQEASIINEAVDGGNDTLALTGNLGVEIDLDRANTQTLNTNLVLAVINVENIIAGGGDDRLAGNGQNNTFTGGAGSDTFIFNNLGGVDTITDFTVADDLIEFNSTVFGDLTASDNVLIASQFSTATTNPTGSTGIVYNSANGKLFYNDNEFAQLSVGLDLTNDNFRLSAQYFYQPTIW